MPRSSYNDQVLRRLEDAAASFLAGEVGVEEVQRSIESTSQLLERNGRERHDALRKADSDIEMARFTLPAEEQQEAVSQRVQLLLAELSALEES